MDVLRARGIGVISSVHDEVLCLPSVVHVVVATVRKPVDTAAVATNKFLGGVLLCLHAGQVASSNRRTKCSKVACPSHSIARIATIETLTIRYRSLLQATCTSASPALARGKVEAKVFWI